MSGDDWAHIPMPNLKPRRPKRFSRLASDRVRREQSRQRAQEASALRRIEILTSTKNLGGAK